MEKECLKRILKEDGADLVGVSNCRKYFPEYSSAVTIGVSALRIYRLNSEDTVQAMNQIMDFLNIKTRQMLQEEGYGSWGALFSQEEFSARRDFVPHRELAVKAGLGVIGKNFLLITPQFGPRIQLTTVLTTMPLLPDLPVKFSPCKNCEICVRRCPTDALKDWFREERCTKCYTCVTVCPVGEDFEEVQQYAGEQHIWTRI